MVCDGAISLTAATSFPTHGKHRSRPRAKRLTAPSGPGSVGPTPMCAMPGAVVDLVLIATTTSSHYAVSARSGEQYQRLAASPPTFTGVEPLAPGRLGESVGL